MKITCPECKKKNSSTFTHCRNCNAPLEDAVAPQKKKRRIIILCIIAGIGLFYGVYKYTLWQLEWTKNIARIIPVDANNDGVDDVIVCYAPHNDEKKSLVKAIDLKNDAVLWKNKTFALRREPLGVQQYINADKHITFLMNGREEVRITALATATGTVLWQKQLEKYSRPWIYNKIFFHKNDVITFYEGRRSLNVISLNKKTGKENWKKELSGYRHIFALQTPVIKNNSLIIPSRDTLFIIDCTNGNSTKKEKFGYAKIWEWRDKTILANSTDRSLYQYNKSGEITPYLVNGRQLRIDAVSTHYIALYSDTIVYIKKAYRKTGPKKKIRYEQLIAQSLLDGKKLYTINLPEGHDAQYRTNARFPDLKRSYFHYLTDRFFPLLLMDFEGKSKNPYHYQWAVIDLDQGSTKLYDNRLKTKYSMSSTPFISCNKYIISDIQLTFREKKTDRHYTVVFNKQKGVIDRVYDVEKEYFPHRFWQVKNNVLYGFSRNKPRLWAIDLANGKTIYHNAGAMELKDGREDIRKAFGF